MVRNELLYSVLRLNAGVVFVERTPEIITQLKGHFSEQYVFDVSASPNSRAASFFLLTLPTIGLRLRLELAVCALVSGQRREERE